MARRSSSTLSRLALHLIRSVAGATPVAMSSIAAAQNAPAVRDTAVLNRSSNPLLAAFRFRSIGPASMGGRIDDIEVAPSNPNVIYVGYAVGGVFRSNDNAV